MTETATSTTVNSDRKADPREVLDSLKRAKILALLKMGCSRRLAAQQVQCARSTITRTAQRDAEFQEQLLDAESEAAVYALKILRRAAQQDKYWRVAAWMLERTDPDGYGRRAANTFRGEQILALLERSMRSIATTIGDDKLEEVMSGFQEVLIDAAEEFNADALCGKEMLEDELERRAAAKSAAKPAPASFTPAAPSVPVVESPANPPRRPSCLDQYVTRRGGKPVLNGNGSKLGSGVCTTLSPKEGNRPGPEGHSQAAAAQGVRAPR